MKICEDEQYNKGDEEQKESRWKASMKGER